MSNVEAWISPSTGEEPLSARDRVLERLRGRNPVAEHREKVQALQASLRLMREGIPEHVELLMSQGKSWDEARRIANERVEDYEKQAMTNLENQAPKTNEG